MTIELFGEGCVLVPAVDQTSARQCLGNRHSLLLPTGNPSNPGISDQGLPRVAKSEDSDEDICDFFNELVPGLAVWSGMRGAGLDRKPDCFLDGQGREMDVIFWGVLNVAAIMGSDLFWSERVVVDDTLDVVVGVALVCEHLEECRTSGSRAT